MFLSDGPAGGPLILLNANWLAKQPTAESVSRILIEEFGHAIDAALNGNADTHGDEGQRFAAKVLNLEVGIGHGSDNDHVQLYIDGRSYDAEAATSTFSTPDGSEFALSFSQGTRKTGGTDNASGNVVGTRYLYSNVVTVGGQQIDAIVKLTGLSNATVTTFDSTGQPYGNAASFQPNLSISAGGVTRVSRSPLFWAAPTTLVAPKSRCAMWSSIPMTWMVRAPQPQDANSPISRTSARTRYRAPRG